MEKMPMTISEAIKKVVEERKQIIEKSVSDLTHTLDHTFSSKRLGILDIISKEEYKSSIKKRNEAVFSFIKALCKHNTYNVWSTRNKSKNSSWSFFRQRLYVRTLC